ncbi:MAG TPA: hypothetical protein VG225_07510 [Terracidiphilus sp.]|jgi:hypothetical protein|nr:hypothetical protein [Terracidiphilus sp.]
MPVLTLEETSAIHPAVRFAATLRLVRQSFRIPGWAIVGVLLLVGLSGFLAGRHKPAHHYVAYFGYPMVLDTTTGKACYAAAPEASDATMQDAAFATDGTSNSVDAQSPSGPAIPMCGNE